MIDEIIYRLCYKFIWKKSFLKLITNTSSNVFIPVSVGGGIKNIKDIEKILNAGADKVFINSAAIKKPKFIKKQLKNLDHQIFVSIETIKNQNGEFICLSNYGREISKRKLIDWFSEAQQLELEIILTSIASKV